MIAKKICPLCKGIGQEQHQYIRDDGETVTAAILCEICCGEGSIILKEQDDVSSRLSTRYAMDKEWSSLEELDASCNMRDS